MAPIAVRDARIGDAAAIARVHVASWRAAYRGIVPDDVLAGVSVEERAARWREWLAHGIEVLVAADVGDVGDRVLGFCAIRREPDAPPEIGALYLDPPAFRRGLGTRLMDEALSRLRAAGERELTLWVLADNAGARAFYARFGFVADGATDTWHGAPEIRLRLALHPGGPCAASTRSISPPTAIP